MGRHPKLPWQKYAADSEALKTNANTMRKAFMDSDEALPEA
jgi:hypothetical protein